MRNILAMREIIQQHLRRLERQLGMPEYSGKPEEEVSLVLEYERRERVRNVLREGTDFPIAKARPLLWDQLG